MHLAAGLDPRVLVPAALVGVSVVAVLYFPAAQPLTLKRLRWPGEPQTYELIPATLPEGFDWEAYRFFNPGLRLSQANASRHYLAKGREAGRLYHPIPLVLRYRTGGGLCNQLYGHISVFTLAVHFAEQLRGLQGKNGGVEWVTVLVPPAQSRATFKRTRGWSSVPADSLLNLDRMAAYFGTKGIAIHKGPMGNGTKDEKVGKKGAKNRWELLRTRCLVVLTTIGFSRWSLQAATAVLMDLVYPAVKPTLLGGPQNVERLCLHLDVGLPYMALHGGRSLPQITEAARGLSFAPEIVMAAAGVVQKLGKPFVGVHLRVEGDWDAGRRSPLSEWIQQMRELGFNHNSTLYVASGVFSYQSTEEIDALKVELQKGGVYGRFLHKELLMPESVRQGLHQEQLALVDLQVLAQAEAVVGHCQSSFSIFLRELRALRGLPKSTFRFASHPRCQSPDDPPDDPYKTFMGAALLTGEPWPDATGAGGG